MKIRPGGLLRCCIETLIGTRPEETEGNTVKCEFCSLGKMVYSLGAWEWVNDKTPE
jgi:hypothetical protein